MNSNLIQENQQSKVKIEIYWRFNCSPRSEWIRVSNNKFSSLFLHRQNRDQQEQLHQIHLSGRPQSEPNIPCKSSASVLLRGPPPLQHWFASLLSFEVLFKKIGWVELSEDLAWLYLQVFPRHFWDQIASQREWLESWDLCFWVLEPIYTKLTKLTSFLS